MLIWWIVGSVMLVISYFIIVILVAYFFEYSPKEKEEINLNQATIDNDLPLEWTVYTWNIGYAGLDHDSDFFYDGGKMMRPSKIRVEENINGIIQEISTWKDADIVFLQEVDVRSKRSWYLPLRDRLLQQIQNIFPVSVFTKNYDVKYVPIPILNPLGKVESGLLTLSKYGFASAQRMAYPANFPFPKGLYFLKRCFLVTRIQFQQKEIVFVNTHNSAFDGGILKSQEMDVLKKFISNEYTLGNYVIIGGDWNQVPYDFEKNLESKYEETCVPQFFPDEDWKWVTDQNIRSNRKVDTPYIEGKTYTTVFDFYLLSPNVEALSIECLDRKFKFSDHQPVKIKIALKD